MTLRCAIFDLDQTVATTASLLYASWNAAIAAVGRPAMSDAEIVALFGPPEWQALRVHVGPADFPAAFDAYLRHYITHHSEVRVCDGIEDVLRDLGARGVFRAMLTGKGRATTEVTLALLGLRAQFDFVVTGDELAQPKPAPEGIELLMRRARATPAETVMIGDLPSDIGAACAAGAQSVAALWACEDPQTLLGAGPSHTAASAEELSALLRRDSR